MMPDVMIPDGMMPDVMITDVMMPDGTFYDPKYVLLSYSAGACNLDTIHKDNNTHFC